jgi:diguanylate cyclase (GGDEF)-like protein
MLTRRAGRQRTGVVTMPSTMNGGTEVLWLSAAALAVSSASLTGFGMRQRRYRGWPWWTSAMWLTTAGLALVAAMPGRPEVLAVATVLLVQWPIVTLIGLRRFHGRLDLPGNDRLDWSVLAVAAGAAASGPLWPADGALGTVIPPTATLLAHLYAASLLFGGPEGRDGVPLRLLGATMCIVGVAPVLLALPAGDAMTSIEMRAVAAGLGSVVLAFISLLLVCERTERQLRDSRRRLQVLANMDELTKVPNRRHFQELASLALRNDKPGTATLLMFDIDHFKRINDHLGHAAGDRALRLVSGSVTEHLRLQDVAGRHGGDEFVLLLRQTSVRDAMAVASRIVARIQAQAEELRLPALTLSFGVVQMRSGEPIDDAVRRADQALYEAKRQGRSRAVAAMGDEERPVFTESQRLGLTSC